MDKTLDLLGLRLTEIEQKLYGYPSEIHLLTDSVEHSNETWTCNDLNLLKMLYEVENKLKTLTIGKDRISQYYNELKRLEKWLTEDDQIDYLLSTFGSHASVVKFEEVLAFEDEIISDSERITELKDILPCLDQPHLGKMDQLEPKLIRLKLELLNLQQKSKELDNEIKDLIQKFNFWYQGVLEKLKLFNEDLMEMERKQEEIKYDI